MSKSNNLACIVCGVNYGAVNGIACILCILCILCMDRIDRYVVV